MTDRELLDLAKKAAGIDWLSRWWNPLTDDGDALRLAVNLRLRIDYVGDQACVEGVMCPGRTAEEACRRAIVRAAAAIGAQPSQGVK